MFGRLLGWYTVYIFSAALAYNGILPGAKFTLRPSLALSYIGIVTARHSNSGRQTNFAALSRGRHLFNRAAISLGILVVSKLLQMSDPRLTYKLQHYLKWNTRM